MLNSKTDEKQSWKGEGRMELIIRSRCIFSFQANTNHPGNCQFLFVKRKNAQQFLNSYFHSKFYWYPGMDFFCKKKMKVLWKNGYSGKKKYIYATITKIRPRNIFYLCQIISKNILKTAFKKTQKSHKSVAYFMKIKFLIFKHILLLM